MCEKEWLQCYYDFSNLNNIESISYFTLIWNVFEKKCCAGYARMDIHPQRIANATHATDKIVEEVFNYFKNRYISVENLDTEYFKQFKFPEAKKNEVRNIFLTPSVDKENKVLALLYIAFRLRNNLYHGEKEVNNLYAWNAPYKLDSY